MSDVSRLFGEYLGSASVAKQEQIAEASAVKQAQFGATGYREGAVADVGLTPEPTVEDFLDYGSTPTPDIVSRNAGRNEYIQDATADRGYLQAGSDAAIDVVNGVFQGALGIGAVGAGLVDADAGAAVSGAAQDVNDWLTRHQSDALNDRRQANAERNSVTSEHNAQLREEEKAAGSSDFMSGLRQVGRDIIDGVSNSDSLTFQSGTNQGIGSLLLGGVIGKGLKVAGGALAARTAVGAAGPSRAAFLINRATQAGAMPAAIGALEGGGAYTQTVNQVMAMSHEDLMKGSPDYAHLIETGWSSVDAKAEIANHAGLTAAAIQAPIGVATGALVSKFEAAPFAATGLKNRVGNVLRETVEEGLQSGSGQLATNFAIEQNANEDQSLTEGVGQAAGEGALYGMGTAGALQGPGVPVDIAKAAGRGVVKAVGAGLNAIEQRGLSVQSSIDAEAPNSLVNTQAPADEAANQLAEPGVLDDLRARVAENSSDPDESVQAIDRLIGAVSFDGAAEADQYQGRPGIQSILSGSTDRFDALKKMSAAVGDKNLSPQDRIGAGLWLRKFTNEHSEDTIEALKAAYGPLDQEDPAVASLDKLAGIVVDFKKSPEVARAIGLADGMLDRLTANQVKNDERWAKIAADVAIHAPEKAQLEPTEQVLEMASDGKLPLTEAERKSLEATVAMLRVQQSEEEATQKFRLKSSHDVSFDIQDGDDDAEFKSLVTHQKLISLAVHVGNLKAAKARLQDLMLFAQHMNNKVGALNTNLALGNGGKDNTTTYQGLSRVTRQFTPQKDGLWVNPIAPDSVRNAQRVAEDARAVVTLANDLAKIHSELGVQPIDLTELDQDLQQPAEQVRREFKARKKAAAQVAADASAPLAQEGSQVESRTEADADVQAEVTQTRSERIKAVTAQLKQQVPGKLRSVLAYSVEMAKGTADEGRYRFSYTSQDGKSHVTGAYVVDGDFLHSFDIGDRQNPVEFSRGDLRSLFDQLAAKHPGVTVVQAFRMTGARATPEEMWFEREGTKFIFRKSDPREAQPGVEGEAAPVERQRDEGAAKPKTGGDAEAQDQITNEPDHPEVDGKSEVVGTEAEIVSGKSDESPTEAVAGDETDATSGVQSAVPTVLKELFPKLFSTDTLANKFLESFKLPAKPISRLLGMGDKLLNTVYGALQSMKSLRELAGEDNRFFAKDLSKNILDDYRRYILLAKPIMESMTEQLGAFLTKNGTRIVDGDPVNSWVNGKALNLVEQDENGNLGYNLELLQGATAAALHWLLIANSSARNQDREDIAKRLGVDIADVPSNAEAYFNYGYPNVNSKRQLAQMIRRFWGVQESPDALIGNSEGIIEAMAGELLNALSSERVNLLKVDEPIEIGKIKVQRLLPVKDTEASKVIERLKQSKADLLEKLFMVEPEETLFIGEPPAKVPAFQMGSSMVKTTKAEQDLIARYQKVPFLANMRMVELYESLTEEQFTALFGAEAYDAGQININHAKSIDGQRITAMSSYATFKELLGHIRQKATEDGVNPDEVEVFYDYGISSVGRLHMLGRNNPQASKILREIILPTKSTVDLEGNDEHRTMFLAAVAQHWGAKVHQIGLADIGQVVEDLASSQLAKSIELMTDRKPGPFTDEELGTLKDEFGGDWGPGALHALQDYIRFKQGKDLSSFDTSLYLEADGVTDGPINAMIHMGMGADGGFTSTWVQVMAKGGLFIGDFGEDGRHFSGHFKNDPTDLYTAVKDGLVTRLGELETRYADNSQIMAMTRALSNLMTEMMKDMEVGADGTITIKRGITKNPVTVTVYGSGANGIAGKIVDELLGELYARMSDPASHGSIAELGAEINALTNHQVRFSRKSNSLFVVQEAAEQPKDKSFKNYTFTRSQEKNLRTVVRHLFVEPMIQAMDDVIGETRRPVESMRDAVQIQSIFLQHAFQDELGLVADTRERRGDLFTRREIKQAQDRLKHMAPYVHTGTQSFFIAGSDKVDIRDRRKVAAAKAAGKTDPKGPEFGQDFAGNFRSSAYVEGPVNAGVKAAPTMVIGPGDGQMIQNYGTDPASPDGLPVFDGYNLSIADAKRGSELMNKAVFEGWKRNPLADVAERFAEFVANVDLSDMNEEMQAELSRVLFPDGGVGTVDEIAEAIKYHSEQLNQFALVQQARKNVLARTTLRVDHMASAEASFENKGQITIASDDPQVIEAELNKHLDEELARLRKDQPGNKKARELSENIAPELSTLGELSETSGTRTAGMTEVRRMARNLNIPHEHKRLLDAVLKQLEDGQYQLTFGTLEQINTERAANNQSLLGSDDKVNHGFTLAAEKRVYLISPTSETLVHELVHAVTFDKVHAFYNDPASLSQEQRDAVTRIEAMMAQWIGHALEQGEREIPNLELQVAYRDALRAIQSHLGRGNKAAALNEFMAWNLANRELIAEGRKISIVGTLAQIARDVLEAIKSLVWGKTAAKLAPAVANDLYSNLRFNTEVLMNSAPSIEQALDDAVLEHSTGATDRLQAVRDAFKDKIERTTNALASRIDQDNRRTEIAQQLLNATDMVQVFRSRGFPMSQLQADTFENIVLALLVDANLNPNALVRTQQIYSAVMKDLKVEDFLADPDTATDADRHDAQEKLNTLRGLHGTKTDNKNRSTLLSTFVALATVDDGFRSILSKMPVPKSEKNGAGTLDAFLENLGTEGMDRVAKAFSGEGHNAASVQAAIDALQAKMTANKVGNVEYIDQFTDKAGETIDTFNDLVVNSVQNLSKNLYDKLDSVEQGARNRLVEVLARWSKAVVSIVNEEKSEIVAQGVVSAMNRKEIPTILREFITEIVGRTQSNKTIYDMIKAVRTFVQQTRQQFREHLPKQLAKHFSRELTTDEWKAMFHGLAKTDLASLAQRFSTSQLLNLVKTPAAVVREINRLENQLQAIDPANFAKWQSKGQQLADYMLHGYPGDKLLRNALAVANLHGELSTPQRRQFNVPAQATIDMIDQLVSLYALQQTDQSVLDNLKTLIDSEQEGMTHIMGMLVGQRKDEMAKVAGSSLAQVNHFKGHVPTENKAGVSLIVQDDSKFSQLRKRGYVRVGPYQGSNAERNASAKSYYFAPVSGRAMYMQGIMQNVRQTAYGVDPRTGFANGVPSAGVITDLNKVDTRALRSQGGESLMPIRDADGEIIGYERSLDPLIAAKLEPNQEMHKVMGIWHGRQMEERLAQDFNQQLIERLGEQWRQERLTKSDEYVNLFAEARRDKIIADSVSLLTEDARDMIESEFGRGNFWVRRDMVNDALGYRSPSVSDLWTGISRWSPEVRTTAQNVAMGIFGKDAFQKLVKAEQTYQTFVADAKVTIVVKSVVVPIANMLSNVYHLAGRGVPLKHIVKGFPAKAAEVDFFIKNRLRRMELQAQLRSAEGTNNLPAQHKIKAELKSILDSNRRLSIWPLIEAGEFASISDAGISNEEIQLSEGRLSAYIEKLTDKLPPELKTAAKYGMVARDTALFKGLQRAVEYGDFLAKAVLYDDLTGRQKKSHVDALGKVTEEFINYDRQPGRWRSGLENNGLLWFWNFKLRAAKIALSVLRNNPLHLFLAHLAPVPDFLGLDIGTPVTDNFVSVIANDKQGWSMGLDQGLRAHLLNPWVNLLG